MTLLVAEKHQGVADPGFVQRRGKGTGADAKNAVLLVTMREDIFATKAADYVVTPVAGDFLCAIIPEQNFPVAPNQTDSGLQAVQNGAGDIRVLKFRHAGSGVFLTNPSIGREGKSFRGE